MRPDEDGKLTLTEANDWYRNGNGQPLYVDLDKIDLANLTPADFDGIVGKEKTIQLLQRSRDGLIYGNVRLKYIGNNQVKGKYDDYNFEMHHGSSIDTKSEIF